MSRKNRAPLAERVVKAAEAALAAQDYVSPLDVLVGIGWLPPTTVQRWRQGEIDCLEREVSANLPRISDPKIEELYRTHWVSPALSEKKRDQLAQKASRAPDLVAIQPL